MPRGNPTPVRTVRVPDDLWAKIVALAEREGLTVSEVVVQALVRHARIGR